MGSFLHDAILGNFAYVLPLAALGVVIFLLWMLGVGPFKRDQK